MSTLEQQAAELAEKIGYHSADIYDIPKTVSLILAALRRVRAEADEQRYQVLDPYQQMRVVGSAVVRKVSAE